MHARISLVLLCGAQLYLFAPASIAAPEPDSGAPSPVQQLSLADTVNAALARDPRLALPDAYRQEAGAWDGRVGKLFAAPPSLTVDHWSDQTAADRGFREWEVGVELPLWRPGERRANREVGETTGVLATRVGQALQLEVAGAVRESLWDLAIAEEGLNLARQNLENAEQVEKTVARRVELGDLPDSDLLLAREETLIRKDEYTVTLTEQRHAEERYTNLTGLRIRPASLTEYQSQLRTIREDHPLLQQAQARVNRAGAEQQRVRKSGMSNPSLMLGARRTAPANGIVADNSVGIGLRLPLGGRAHLGAAVAAAHTGLVTAESERDRLRRTLELSLHEALHSLETLHIEVGLLQAQRQLAQESLRRTRKAFDLGEANLVDLLRAQLRAVNAQRSALIELRAQRAVARYNQAVGVMP